MRVSRSGEILDQVDPDLPHGVLLELHPLPRRDEPRAIYRLKRAIKMLLRAYRFRVESYCPLRAKDGRQSQRKAS